MRPDPKQQHAEAALRQDGGLRMHSGRIVPLVCGPVTCHALPLKKVWKVLTPMIGLTLS